MTNKFDQFSLWKASQIYAKRPHGPDRGSWQLKNFNAHSCYREPPHGAVRLTWTISKAISLAHPKTWFPSGDKLLLFFWLQWRTNCFTGPYTKTCLFFWLVPSTHFLLPAIEEQLKCRLYSMMVPGDSEQCVKATRLSTDLYALGPQKTGPGSM